jgi:hypothetical protein
VENGRLESHILEKLNIKNLSYEFKDQKNDKYQNMNLSKLYIAKKFQNIKSESDKKINNID